jgi:hypothetical protein
MSEKKSFWATVPGILTGTATVITAGLGLLAALSGSDTTGNTTPPTPQVTASATATPSVSGTRFPQDIAGLPEADIVPQSLDFGDHGLTAREQQPVTILNSGRSDLFVDDVTINGNGASSFEVLENTCGSEALAPRSRCEINVGFSPQAVGSYTATLEISHNAQDTPSRIPLRGEGVLLKL